jgi:hypothetical protein
LAALKIFDLAVGQYALLDLRHFPTCRIAQRLCSYPDTVQLLLQLTQLSFELSFLSLA